MIEREVVNIRAGRQVRAAYSVRYLSDVTRGTSPIEAVEFLLDTGPSVLLSCATDWTLKVTEGRWPELPSWCHPAESWAFEEVETIGKPGFSEIVSSSEIHNPVGELCGIRLEFPAAWFTVKSGEALTLDFSPKDR
ncbi:hypothetical protein [Streptomyces sp. ICBB 8177]|uniref:hypothetical protein n=1 Tax=Streptomyces sp. ICBB 8177 TaxID=563922 RepID=UPI000D676E70|nr:hypothetical protein [Streptomyces sp. ICBB 8177]PWI41371.1 hypothetical protein CK485_20925 [Streptomyces sp. ICBB 8177]